MGVVQTTRLDKQTIEYLYEKYNNILIKNSEENTRPVLEKFNDIEINAWYYESIKELYDKELIRGYDDKSFKPNAFITREEAAQIASKIASISVMKEAKNGVSVNKFIDVNDDRWSSEAINYLRKNKIMLGRDENKFDPKSEMTREETAVLANRILDFRGVPRMEKAEKPFGIFSDSKEISGWAKAEVNLLYTNSIIKGYPDGTYKPRVSITRAEFTSIMHKIMKSIESSDVDNKQT